MKTIYQYQMIARSHSFSMPQGAKIIHVGMHEGLVTFWAEVEVNNAIELREFTILGTGDLRGISVTARYVGTALDGPSVWHLYEEVRP